MFKIWAPLLVFDICLASSLLARELSSLIERRYQLIYESTQVRWNSGMKIFPEDHLHSKSYLLTRYAKDKGYPVDWNSSFCELLFNLDRRYLKSLALKFKSEGISLFPHLRKDSVSICKQLTALDEHFLDFINAHRKELARPGFLKVVLNECSSLSTPQNITAPFLSFLCSGRRPSSTLAPKFECHGP
jgi:hypothetical protein